MRKAGDVCEPVIVGAAMLAILSLILPTTIAAKNDWHLAADEENMYIDQTCPASLDGEDHIVGTFEWESGPDPGFTFEFTYNNGHDRENVYPGWESPYYVFDFDVIWTHGLDYAFRIYVSEPTATDFVCYFS